MKNVLIGFLCLSSVIVSAQDFRKSDRTGPEDASQGTQRIQPNQENNKEHENETGEVRDSAQNVLNDESTSATSSPSGSPGVLADDEEQRDGTNTIQRAKPNIAGAEIPKGTGYTGKINESNIVRDEAVNSSSNSSNSNPGVSKQTQSTQKATASPDTEAVNGADKNEKADKKKNDKQKPSDAGTSKSKKRRDRR